MSIFNFKNWPLGLEELQVYGNEQLSSVVDHFTELLIRNDCDIDSVPLEWVELKIYVSGLVAAEPAVSYLALWQRVIRQNEDRFKNIILVLKIVLLIPIHTSEVERGFSLMNRVKQDWWARLTTPHLNELMRISLLGPACNAFEPMEAIRLWWQGGRRARRPQIQPHGPRRRQARCEHDLDAGDSSDSEEEQ